MNPLDVKSACNHRLLQGEGINPVDAMKTLRVMTGLVITGMNPLDAERTENLDRVDRWTCGHVGSREDWCVMTGIVSE